MADQTTPQKTYVLCITKDSVTSSDPEFTVDDLSPVGNYDVRATFYIAPDGTPIVREKEENEHQISAQTMPRLACQVFEKQLAALSEEELRGFPICRYPRDGIEINGIHIYHHAPTDTDKSKFDREFENEYGKDALSSYGYRNDGDDGYKLGWVTYRLKAPDGTNGQTEDRYLAFYSYRLFSTIPFVQGCLRLAAGQEDDDAGAFVLIYRKSKDGIQAEPARYRSAYSPTLIESKNLIFHGAPGTGKSYLAKQIAADIISGGQTGDFAGLSAEQKEQVGFVQFHPSYDYTDFVEGLRPVKTTEANAVGFELRPGVFKQFADRARAPENAGKKYVFIIDEINRGEISKIFGELFFSVDPGYRGPAGEISTQYAYMHGDPDEKFYIPDNVYIIGTMNDIDRSVDSFDFAMRRRFRFVELKANEQAGMLDVLGNRKEEAVRRMEALNREIAATPDLNENYQIGPAYFLKLKELNFDLGKLWTDHLQPLLREYVRGMDDENGIMKRFKRAYDDPRPAGDDENGTAQDQG